MKKITEKRKNEKRNQLILGLILISVMFLSVLGYALREEEESEEEKVIYNNFEFEKNNDFWYLSVENFNFVFKNNPFQIEEIPAQLKGLNNYKGKPLYIYSEEDEASSEIYINLNQLIQRMQFACLESLENCEENSPTKTCEDNFIIIRVNNNTRIVQEENCVFIQGKKEEIVGLVDEFLFKIIGVR
ncbi:MAG: hypothetical protein KKF68_00150 [Nanoarchaeota archaeon]|nr:hypothetical protein [Nanoarchaeota archaeon]